MRIFSTLIFLLSILSFSSMVNGQEDCESCYGAYFAGLDVDESSMCQYVINADQFSDHLSSVLYDRRNPLWTIHDNGEWVMYYHIENWQGPVTAIAITNLTNTYETLANEWIEDLTNFDPDAPQNVSIKVFGFVFNEGVQVDSSFYNVYGDYPIVTNWQKKDENAPWKVVHRSDGSSFNQNWYGIDDFDALKAVGNDIENNPNANYSPMSWDSYVHPENVDMFYTKFWHKTTWDAVAQRQYLKVGGQIKNYATGQIDEFVFSHEMGHTFFHDDFYDDGKYPDADGLVSIMNDCCNYISDFDKGIMRRIWEAQKYRANLALDEDGDGFCANVDCDDDNPSINPDAEEISNNDIDENCDGSDIILFTDDLSNAEFTIYPNPVIDDLNIDFLGEHDFYTEIYNTNGEFILSSINQSTIDVQSLPKGIYLIEVKDITSGASAYRKFVKAN